METFYDACILGAGAAGLTAGAEAASRGLNVAVLDHGPRVARKVLVSGGGRCNLTNASVGAGDYLSGNPHFCKSALAGFTPADMLARFGARGLSFRDEDRGRLFCEQGAPAVARAMEEMCREAGGAVMLGRAGLSVARLDSGRPDGARFRVDTGQETLACRLLLVALGGPAWPGAGASALGLDIARQMGLGVIPPRPALVPLTMPRGWPFAALAGISLPVDIACGKAQFQEALLFTHRGLSGPAALQVSAHVAPDRPVRIDLLPGRDLAALAGECPERKVLFRTFLSRHLSQRLAQLCAAHLLPPGLGEKRLGEIGARELAAAARAVHGWTLAPAGNEGLAKAEATAGGVDTRELSSRTLESTGVPGLYFAGEVVDVTGQLGGYNLHWAVASGLAAGRAMARAEG
jgi:predicted Rossmann fold flavoprotein